MPRGSKKDLLVSFVIDESGSMSGQERATTEGFNAFIKGELDAAVGNTYVTETLFNTHINPRYVGVEASNVPKFGSKPNPYRPSGGTALFDAVGVTIAGTERWLENNRWFKGKVLIVVWTDGYENSSREYNIRSLNEMIDQKTAAGWTFQFMGTGEAGWLQGRAFDIKHQVRIPNTYAGNVASYTAMNTTTTALRGGEGWGYDQSLVDEAISKVEG